MKKIHYLFIIILIAFPSEGKTQDLIRANPADLTDAHTLFINPAVVQFQNFTFNTRLKSYQVGFLDNNLSNLSSIFISSSLPPNVLSLPGIGIGATLESFNTPDFRDVGIGLSLGYSMSPTVAFGISAKGYNRYYSFNFDNVEHINDPLFKDLNTWNMSFGAGFLIRPIQNFMFGISCNNINRPDLSLSDSGANQPIIFDFGLKYDYKNFAASIFGNYQQDELTFGIIGEAKLYNKGILKTGYQERSLLVEGQLKLLAGLSLVYRMDYPLYEVNHYSYGSHQVGFSWQIQSNEANYRYNIRASVDTVKAIKQRSILRIDKILAQDLEQISPYLDAMDFEFPEDDAQEQVESTPVNLIDDPEISLNKKSYEGYRKKIEDLFSTSKKTFNKKNTIDIYYHDDATEERALKVKNYLVYDLGMNEDYIKIYKLNKKSAISDTLSNAKVDSIKNLINERFVEDESEFVEVVHPWIEKLVPQKIYFYPSNVIKNKVHEWRIVIRNLTGKIVHVISGYSQIPDLVEWDGFKSDETLMPVGNYYYSFQYSTRPKQWLPKKPKQHRIVFIDVTRDQIVHFTPTTPVYPDNVDIILK